jgi:hypothetical protein
MNITDLNHLEVITEDTTIVGGWRRNKKPSAFAESTAVATAVGFKSYSASATLTEAVAGLYSKSVSASVSEAEGYSG